MPNENNVPNIDCTDTSELMLVWNKYKRGRNYRELFPSGGKGTKLATADIASYASNLHAARTSRLRGDIVTAKMYENICDSIYQGLPEFARW
jgi:hypothetical protein